MSVVLETSLGDITVDLFVKERPLASLNFLKLCKAKYYNLNLFHTIQKDFIAQTGDPTGTRNEGTSVYGLVDGSEFKFFPAEKTPIIKHTRQGLLSFVGNSEGMIASQFFITLGNELSYLDERHCVFGEVMEGLDVLEVMNESLCDMTNRPYTDVRITHTVILEDPFEDMAGLIVPARSPSPTLERLRGGRIAADEEIDDTKGKDMGEVIEMMAEREAKARATILEMVGDIPEADMAPPENVLFVCKLNPVTSDDDLEIIFGRFGKIVSCEVIRDKKSGDSLQYAFVEFDNPKSCEDAYFKMDNVLIDDRRIHVDFSQSVAKVKWHGKGRGITTFDDQGKQTTDKRDADLGKGIYKRQERKEENTKEEKSPKRPRERSPRRRSDAPRHRDDRKRSPERSHTKHERAGRDRSGHERGKRDRRDASRSRHRDRRDSSRSHKDDRRRRPRSRSDTRRHQPSSSHSRHDSSRARNKSTASSSSKKTDTSRKGDSSSKRSRKSSEKSTDDSRHARKDERTSRRK